MSIESRLHVSTPEGIQLDVVIAGLGSRFLAAVLDLLLIVTIMFAPIVVVSAVFGETGWTTAFVLVWMFLSIFGYYPFFETIWSGRTIGKRAAGIRVVGSNGTPIGFVASAVRNLVRIIDFLPFFYGVGTVSILATTQNRRLGDFAADTYVIRERAAADRGRTGFAEYASAATRPDGVPQDPWGNSAPGGWSPSQGIPTTATPPSPPDVEAQPWLAWDVSAVNLRETALARRFLERRWSIEAHARAHLASDLAARLRPKVPAAPDWPDETFLECIVATKSSRG